ncbi:hypothetical protein DICPUDRAFT_37625 [Dictyostelium purpureum]|uniref:Exocyst component Exo84 C-terminal domain-containing protein n=1 Tax=Dictyostelium purpureum TaxID=5786 RepID=F0ZT56_DICPU|nr:uncharacterized protein DICPUDRAFT_37625 [Dictyostelium purpureum]EGC32875.1 hypothetical protein DICPUDRAFT_37625 [Dictyostelium purpureum]|eukprot:XP_003290594.1 hypothetical protein DICPUDRAFT_37625 [Dictyostelium purpureum]
MKKGVKYPLKVDSNLSTVSSSVNYPDIECLDIKANGNYIVRFMHREWVGPLTELSNPKTSIKISIDIKECTVTATHTDKKKTVHRWGGETKEKKSGLGGVNNDEDNPVQYETFSSNSFNPEKYVNDLFTHKTDLQANTHLNWLEERKTGCIDHLKKDVYKNHLIFIGASKEIANSEVDMLDFRNLVTDYGNNISSLQNLSISWDHYKVKKNNKIDFEPLSPATEPIQWLTTAPNELSVSIEQREFETAVSLVEKINKIYESNPKVEIVMQTHPLKDRIESKVKILTDKLMNELRSPLLKPNQIKETISLLVRLSQNDKAKTIFLESRSHAINLAVKKIALSGDLNRYISELTRVVFNNINATCNDFTNSFPSYMNSGLISWVIDELVLISDIFNRKVFILDSFYSISQVIRIVESHCEMMDQTGLSIGFYWNLLLQPHIEQLIVNYELKIRDNVLHHLMDEKWIGITNWDYELKTSPTPGNSAPSSLKNSAGSSNSTPKQKQPNMYQNNYENENEEIDHSKLKLTESTIFLNTIIQKFANDICQIISIDLVPVISQSLGKIFSAYMNYLQNEIQKDSLTDIQCLAIISDSVFIVDDLVFRIATRFEDATGEKLNNLKQLSQSLYNLFESIRDQYASRKAMEFVMYTIKWSENNYREEYDLAQGFLPKDFIILSDSLDSLSQSIKLNVNSESILPIASRIISEIVVIISQRFQTDKNVLFSYSGLQYFVLEMKYLTTFAGKYPVEDYTFELINSMIQTHSNNFAESNSLDPSTVLQPDEFFTGIIDSLVYQKAVYN